MANDETPAANRRSLVAAYFGRLANTYGEGEYYTRRRAAVVAALAPELGASRWILDLGCGNGAYLYEFATRYRDARIVGVDVSSEMLSAARRRVGTIVKFVRADAGAIPFALQSWDLIFCSHVLPFVPDLDRCVTEIARCLGRGGVMVATLEGSDIRARLRGVMKEEEWERIERLAFATGHSRLSRRSEEDYRASFERAGLEVELR